MFPLFDATDAYGRNGRKSAHRGSKHQAPVQKNHQAHPGRHEPQRRRHAADCDEASLEIRNALRSY